MGAVGSGIKHLGKKMEKRARGMGQAASADGLSAQLCARDPSNCPALPCPALGLPACLSVALPGTHRCWVVFDGLEAAACVPL